MARKKKPPEPEPPPPGSAIRRIVLTLLAACLILYVSAFLFARTEGFRSYLSGRLAKSTGLELEIAASRMTWNGDFLFSGVRTAGTENKGAPGLQAQSVRLDVSIHSLIRMGLSGAIRRVEIDGWQVDFGQDAEGRWEPAPLIGISGWMGQWGALTLPDEGPRVESVDVPVVGEDETLDSDHGNLSDAMDYFSSTVISLNDGDMTWFDASGDIQASVHDASFLLTPLPLPTREAAHYHLKVASVVMPDHQRVLDLDIELIHTGGTDFVINLVMVRQSSSGSGFNRVESTPPDEIPAPRSGREAAFESDGDAVLNELIRDELEEALSE